jgi:hypothetical protein
MAYTARVVVIASQTAESDDLLAALKARAERGPIEVTLLMPAAEPGRHGLDGAAPKLEAALEKMRAAGLQAEGVVGDHDPIEAVVENCPMGRFDEVIVSTLPGASSKWMRADFPHRVGRLTDLTVTHVISRPPGHEERQGGPPPRHEREPLGPLSVLSWSRSKPG